MDECQRWVDAKLGTMDIAQKVGQLLVFGFCGPVITADRADLIHRHHLGGLRISQGFHVINLFNDVKPSTEPEEWTLRSLHPPAGPNRDFGSLPQPTHCTPAEYAGVLNRLRQIALDRPGGVPLHFTVDQEGSASDDLLFGMRLLPHPMGLAASGDPADADLAARTISTMARALGVNRIHSPVLDVNTNPRNPEVGTRAYGDDTALVSRFALESLRGFNDGGLIATGKPVVVSNTIYDPGVPPEIPTAITSFNPGGREHMRVVAEAHYGKRRLTASLPVSRRS